MIGSVIFGRHSTRRQGESSTPFTGRPRIVMTTLGNREKDVGNEIGITRKGHQSRGQ